MNIMKSLTKVCLIFLLVCIVAPGCSLMKIKTEANKSLASTILVGHVSTSGPGKAPVIVAAYSKTEGKREIAHYTVLHESGEYELIVPPGDYYIFAFIDQNSNLIYDEGEAAGQYGEPKMVSVPAGGVIVLVDFGIPEEGSEIDFPRGRKISPVKPREMHSRMAGAIADFDHVRFSAKTGEKGFREPVEFFKELGGNIYFLDPYDPRKIPVLFVHGAGGSIAEWKHLVGHIDRTRFQPWFFYYPSGARIKSMSYLLYWKLINLQIKYKFDKLYITAHSMGGLVVRSFIVDYGRFCPYIKLFISLATPWGGDRMAQYGVKQSPAVIPSWIDMQPESEFIQSLYREKMPETISFYMFSGHRGGRNPFQSNNDGTISLTSIQDLRPQAEAKMNYIFNEDHVSILTSRDVITQYNTIINSFDENNLASNPEAGGYLQIHFSYDDASADMKPWSTLLLRRADKKHTETMIFLSSGDTGRLLGPFPPGNYRANIIADAFKGGEKSVSVHIESNKTKELNFVFTPDGIISGYVTAALKPEDRPAGMPADRYLPADKTIGIQSVTLKGNGIDRIIHPLDEKADYIDYVLSRTDFCYRGYFNFFGLPAGIYEIEIRTRGYTPVRKKYAVTPGAPAEMRATELTPE